MEKYTPLKTRIKNKFKNDRSSNSCIYFLGVIGACVHYFSIASGFGAGVVGFLKALVWPAILVYKSFEYLT